MQEEPKVCTLEFTTEDLDVSALTRATGMTFYWSSSVVEDGPRGPVMRVKLRFVGGPQALVGLVPRRSEGIQREFSVQVVGDSREEVLDKLEAEIQRLRKPKEDEDGS